MLLKEQGYEVLGVSFKFWGNEDDFYLSKALYHQRKDALKIAHHLDIPWQEVDAQVLFREKVVTPFAEDYLSGRTPNPCIDCNPYVKIHLLQELARHYGDASIATGHYVGKVYQNEKWFLTKGSDSVKDQSYMLWKLSSQQLQQAVFPLAGYSKSDIKEFAARKELSFLSRKRESYNICFLQGRDYRDWLKTHHPERIVPGDIIDGAGKKIGTHEGIAFYTIGTELSTSGEEGRMFVEEVVPESNVLVATPKEALCKKELLVENTQLYHPELFYKGSEVMVRIRGKEQEHLAIIEDMGGDKVRLYIPGAVFAPSPGQSAVFYEKEVVVGGGIISCSAKR